jgi:hypothetical protein
VWRLVNLARLRDHRLHLDPFPDVGIGKPPTPAHLEGRDLLGGSQTVNGPLGDLEVLGYVPNEEDFAGHWFDCHTLVLW